MPKGSAGRCAQLSLFAAVVLVLIAITAVFAWPNSSFITAAKSNRQIQQLDPDVARTAGPSLHVAAAKAYGHLPLSFQPNQGSTNSKVKFLARGQGYTLFLTHGAAVFAINRNSDDRAAESSG